MLDYTLSIQSKLRVTLIQICWFYLRFVKSGALSLDLRKDFCQYIPILKATNRHVDCVLKDYLNCMSITYSLLGCFVRIS